MKMLRLPKGRLLAGLAIAVAIGIGHAPVAYFDDCCGCTLNWNEDLNNAERELREKQEACGTDSWCLIQADLWYKQRVEQINEEYHICVATCAPCGGYGGW